MAAELSLDNTTLSDAVVVLGAAGIVIPLFARFRVNPVIGFILVGMLVGPGGLGGLVPQFPWLYYLTISNREATQLFAELGIILLLFSIGLELSFRRLVSMRNLVFGLGAGQLALSSLLLAGALFAIGQNWAGAIGLGLALALSSTALVVPMTGTQSPVGRSAFGILLFQDLALVPIVFLLGAMAPAAANGGLAELTRTLWQGALVVIVMLVLGRLLLPRLFAQAARAKNPELFLAASLLVVILASVATSAVGLSPIVGALLAGLLIAETDYHTEVEVMTAPFRGLALGVFLITVGMSLDPIVIVDQWLELTAAVVGVLALKTGVTALLLRLSGQRRGVAIETGFLMASPSETTLIVLTAAAAAQLIAPATAAFWQIVVALGLTVTPILARVGRDVARRVERVQGESGPVDLTKKRAIVVGYGRVGSLVADMLRFHALPLVAIDADVDAVAEARRRNVPIVFGDIGRPGMFEHLDVGNAGALILTMDDPAQVERITAKARKLYPELTIVARARDTDHAAQLYRAGASDAVPETLESSLQLSEAALVDMGVAMGPVIASIHEKRDEYRKTIKDAGDLKREPLLRARRASEG